MLKTFYLKLNKKAYLIIKNYPLKTYNLLRLVKTKKILLPQEYNL